jgi:hypothetical protein
MPREYTLSTFLRQTPAALLKQYFDGRGLLAEVDFDALKKTEYQPIIDALDGVTDDQRATVEQDFQEVFSLADKSGTRIILDESEVNGLDLADAIEAMENHYHRAMWLFLNRYHDGRDLFRACVNLAFIKDMSFTKSKRRKDLFLPDDLDEPAHDEATLEAIAGELRGFYRDQGRGRKCKVEYYLRVNPTRHCYFGYPEDYTTSELQYEEDELTRQGRKSVFPVAFVYLPDDGTLEISAPGGKKDAEKLQGIFCRHALLMDGLPPTRNDRCWDLDGLKAKSFPFPTDPADGIKSVEVLALRMHQGNNWKRRITFENSGGAGDLYTWMTKALNEQRVSLGSLTVSQAKLKVTWHAEPGEKEKTLTFTLTTPDSMTLRDQPLHQVVKGYLKTWKLAP